RGLESLRVRALPGPVDPGQGHDVAAAEARDSPTLEQRAGRAREREAFELFLHVPGGRRAPGNSPGLVVGLLESRAALLREAPRPGEQLRQHEQIVVRRRTD